MTPCKHNNHGFCLWCEAEKDTKHGIAYGKHLEKFFDNLLGPPTEDSKKLADAMVELQFKNGNLTRENLEKYKIKRDIEDLEKFANGKS